MNEDEIAKVLDQVVDIGPTPQEAELGAAVLRHVSANRPTSRGPDPDTIAALRQLAARPPVDEPAEAEIVSCSPLSILVDFNALLRDVGEPAVWDTLGKLKDLFGGTT
jgi:hypothetical protein